MERKIQRIASQHHVEYAKYSVQFAAKKNREKDGTAIPRIVLCGVHLMCRAGMSLDDILEFYPRRVYVENTYKRYKDGRDEEKNLWYFLSSEDHLKFLQHEVELVKTFESLGGCQ